MADTIGDMIDKLTIANIRLWHIEDERREFCDKEDKDLEEAVKYLDMVSKVNKERNSLIDQINASLAVLIDKASNRDSSLELTSEEILGTGKNKFYKKEDA
jgi:hypothetical protein